MMRIEKKGEQGRGEWAEKIPLRGAGCAREGDDGGMEISVWVLPVAFHEFKFAFAYNLKLDGVGGGGAGVG